MADREGYPRSEVMRRVRSTDTTPERRLRAELHRRGVRFRLAQQIAPGGGRAIRPDLMFRGRKLAVFVDGCFWHGCAEHCRIPATNREYWVAKIGRNTARDQLTTARLEAAGWSVVRVWEHEPTEVGAQRVADALAQCGVASGRRSRSRGLQNPGSGPSIPPVA